MILPKSNRPSPIACTGATDPDPRDVNIEPVLVPKTHALGDKGEQSAAFRDPRQREMDRFLALGEDEPGQGEAATPHLRLSRTGDATIGLRCS